MILHENISERADLKRHSGGCGAHSFESASAVSLLKPVWNVTAVHW